MPSQIKANTGNWGQALELGRLITTDPRKCAGTHDARKAHRCGFCDGSQGVHVELVSVSCVQIRESGLERFPSDVSILAALGSRRQHLFEDVVDDAV